VADASDRDKAGVEAAAGALQGADDRQRSFARYSKPNPAIAIHPVNGAADTPYVGDASV